MNNNQWHCPVCHQGNGKCCYRCEPIANPMLPVTIRLGLADSDGFKNAINAVLLSR